MSRLGAPPAPGPFGPTPAVAVESAVKAGVPVHVVAQRLGHATPAITLSTYSHVLPRQQSEAAAAFARC